jgi:NADH-quinone oxidoreductase subunit M
MPFHTWAVGAYSRSPLTFSSFFSGAMSKMGIYGLFVFLYGSIGLGVIYKTGNIEFFQSSYFQYTLVWLGVITASLATLKAVMTEDIRVLLAYSSVGQLGYMVIGIGLASTLGLTATLFHVVTHALFKTSLFIVIAAVIHRTGKTKFYELGGLINNMPIAFIATLFSIITLAGIPPLGGFATKWLLYEAMIEKKMVFATVVTMMASVGAFLYTYRLIQSIFLGQRKPIHDDLKPAPLSMQIAMSIPVIGMLVLGFLPNLLIKYTNLFLDLIGISGFKLGKSLTDTAFTNSYGYWNAYYIGSAVVLLFLFSVIYYNLHRRAKIYKVGQLDIYTAGEYVTRETPLNYSYNFYGFIADALKPILKHSMTDIVNRLAKEFISLSDFIRRLYTGNGQHYAIFTMIFAIITLIYFLS